MNNRLLIILVFFPLFSWAQPRNKQTINEHWKFYQGDISNASAVSFDDKQWENIDLPHTWNVEDIEDEPYGWYRGVCWYRKKIKINRIPTDSKRFYLYFEGANQVCEVFVNGQSAGEKHMGGYTPFAYDITNLIRSGSDNLIAIKLDNSHDENIAPLSADFVFYGGIYRDVYLIETNVTHFDMLHQGSGVYITTPQVNENSAKIEIRSDVANNYKQRELLLNHTILDAERNVVTSTSRKIKPEASSQKSYVAQTITVANPKLWSPDSPYLYSVVSEIKDQSGKIIDRVENPLGFRWFRFDPEQGFFLNGKHLKLLGTNRHQDYINYGNALTDDMHRYDLKMMKDLGINCFRISHYPQDPAVLEMADRYGFICFEEIPIINYISRTPEYLENCKKQISEMIRKDYNHPCIVAWNQSNETTLVRPDNLSDEEFNAYQAELATFFKQLKEHIQKKDPTRETMIVHTAGVEEHFKLGYHLGDIVGYNLYLGWYHDNIEDIYNYFERMHKTNPAVSYFISEFGAGADPRIRSFEPLPWDHSIEYQLAFNKIYQKAIMKYPFIAGATAWNFNDFYSEGRREVQPHINNKGLVTSDRRKKDSYYFFRAAWSKEAVASIGSQLWKNRAGLEDTLNSGRCTQPIEIYANTGDVELFLNNRSLGRKPVIDNVTTYNVPFTQGENILELRAEKEGAIITDFLKVDFNVIARNLKSEMLPFEEIAINVGSNCYFIDDKKNNYLWLPDKPYEAGNYGYTQGEAYVRDTKRGILGIVDNIMGTMNEPVYQTQRMSPAYRFDVPKGNYEVSLLFAELKNGEGNRVFDVVMNDNTFLQDINIEEMYGKYTAVSKRFEVSVNDNNGLTVLFPEKEGKSVLNGIIVRKIY